MAEPNDDIDWSCAGTWVDRRCPVCRTYVCVCCDPLVDLSEIARVSFDEWFSIGTDGVSLPSFSHPDGSLLAAELEIERVATQLDAQMHALWQDLLDASAFGAFPGTISPPADEDLYCGGPITVAVPTEQETASEMNRRAFSSWLRNRDHILSRMAETDETVAPCLVPVNHAVNASSGVCDKCGRTMMQIAEDPIAECLLQMDFSSVTKSIVGR